MCFGHSPLDFLFIFFFEVFWGGTEHTYIKDQKMSTCLKMKRTVERSVNPQNVRMACGEVDAIIEKDEYSDKMRVVKIVKDKYGDYTN